MDTLEFSQNNCRICLKQPGLLDWNEEIPDSWGENYKDCYFKYTQLEDNVSDPFSQMLCESCSCDLKRFHFLIQTAIESYNILQETYETFNQPNNMEEKIEIKIEQIPDAGVFETVFFEKSNESTDNTEDKEISSLLNADTSLDFFQDLKNKPLQEKSKTKIKLKKVLSNKKSKLKKVQNYEKSEVNKIKFHKNSEEVIDIPPSLTNCDTAQDKVMEEKVESNGRKSRKYKKIMCAYCPRLLYAKCMKKHEETHKNRDRNEVCPICGTKYLNKDYLKQHMRIHKENRERKYKCDFCDKAYYARGPLNIHRRIHLGQMVSCPICSKEYFRQVDLDVHKARAHSVAVLDKNKYFVECKDCGKNILSNRWRHHKLLHSNKLQVKCTLCDKHFASKVSCHRHVRRFHKYTDDFAKVVIYYGADCVNRSSLTMLKQMEVVKPILEDIKEK